MRKVLKKFVIAIIILTVIDFGIGKLLNEVIKQSPDGRYYKANYSLKTSNEDAIIFGSSRAETNYTPSVFEDSLNLSCWNTGRGGQGLPFWYAMQKGILSRYTPKIVVVNIERDFLSVDLEKSSYERAGFLRPFYYSHPEIRTLVNNISPYERFFLTSKIYAFNSSFYYLFRPYMVKGIDGNKDDKGWKTSNEVMVKSNNGIQKIKTNFKINENTLKLFKNFTDDLLSKNCKVFLVISPNYGFSVESTSTIHYIKTMKNITVLDHSNDYMFVNNNSYYKDFEHLNTDGAIKYSKIISSEILNIIIK